MNVIYYERLIRKTRFWDIGIRIASGLLSSGGIVAAVKWFDSSALAIALGVLSSVLSVGTLVLGLPDRMRAAGGLLPQYVQHYHRLQQLYLQGDDVDPAKLQEALDALDQTSVAEAEKLPGGDEKLLKLAHSQVLREIGVAT